MEEKPKNVFEIWGCSLILPLISQNLLLNLPLNFLAVPFIEKWELWWCLGDSDGTMILTSRCRRPPGRRTRPRWRCRCGGWSRGRCSTPRPAGAGGMRSTPHKGGNTVELPPWKKGWHRPVAPQYARPDFMRCRSPPGTGLWPHNMWGPTLCGAAPPFRLHCSRYQVWGERHRIFQGGAYSSAMGRCHPPFPEGTSFVPSVCWIAQTRPPAGRKPEDGGDRKPGVIQAEAKSRDENTRPGGDKTKLPNFEETAAVKVDTPAESRKSNDIVTIKPDIVKVEETKNRDFKECNTQVVKNDILQIQTICNHVSILTLSVFHTLLHYILTSIHLWQIFWFANLFAGGW